MPDVESIPGPSEGRATAPKVDLLEDFWWDFLHARRDAAVSARNRATLWNHRFLRSGLFAFLNYLTGLVNRWESSIEPGPEAGSCLATIGDRLARLAERYQSPPPPRSDLDLLKNLAERCSDLTLTDEEGLFQALDFDRVDAPQGAIIAWIDAFARSSGLPLQGKTRTLVESFSVFFGDPLEDEHAFDAYAHEPHPFQDPPGTWVDMVAIPDDGQDEG